MLWLNVTLGCLALGMIHQLSGGAWGVLIRRPIGAATRVLPLMTVLFLPIALGLPRMYPWTNADLVAHDEALQHKHLYLNTPFFLVRAAIYFLAWNTIAYFLNAWSLEQDRTGNPQIARRMQTGWRPVGAALMLFHFAVPFVVLLSRTVNRQPELLIKVAVAILCVRLLDLLWLIGPEFRPDGIAISWMDFVVPAALGCAWLAAFIHQLRGRAILPVHDPEFDEALGRIIERGTPPRTAH